jgi:arylsulfatase A-like enzyme
MGGSTDFPQKKYGLKEVMELLREKYSNTALGLKPDQCAVNVIRGRRYKYVHHKSLPPLFFDLKQDPHELENLAERPEYQGLVLEYVQKMASRLMRSPRNGE